MKVLLNTVFITKIASQIIKWRENLISPGNNL